VMTQRQPGQGALVRPGLHPGGKGDALGGAGLDGGAGRPGAGLPSGSPNPTDLRRRVGSKNPSSAAPRSCYFRRS